MKTLILGKCSYLHTIEEIVNDKGKFSKLDIPAGKEINHIIHLEKIIFSELRLLKHMAITDKSTYKSLKPLGSRPELSYGLGKIQVESHTRVPPFCSIPSTVGTPSYKSATSLPQFSTPTTANEYTLIPLTLPKKLVNRT